LERYDRIGSAHLPDVTFTIWGGQFEAGTVATSYIPTLAATVTRAADQVSVTSASINYSATAGSWWVDAYVNDVVGSGRIIGYQQGGNTPIFTNSSTAFGLFDPVAFILKTVPNALGSHKLSAAFASADRALTADGLAVSTDTTAGTALLSPGTFIGIGGDISGFNNVYIRRVRYLPRRPSNAYMVTETT
jgi:hypothetical protein